MFNRKIYLNENNRDFVYANSILKNIDFALVSLTNIFDFKKNYTKSYGDEYTFYFFHIQSILTACGCISDNFYPSGFYGKDIQQRGTRLRQLFDISKNEFPLVFQKEARNTNIHYDERYDRFYAGIGDYNLLKRKTPIEIKNYIYSNPHLRTYDINRRIYMTYDRNLNQIEYNLEILQKELLAMREKIQQNPITNSAWVDKPCNENTIK